MDYNVQNVNLIRMLFNSEISKEYKLNYEERKLYPSNDSFQFYNVPQSRDEESLPQE